MAPWADALFAIDFEWWDKYLEEVRQNFRGVLYSTNQFHNRGILTVHKPFNAFGNSGGGALALANAGGAGRVILLGYDGQKTGGKAHWHGDHPPGLVGNAGSVDDWPEKFTRQAVTLSCEVINCTRETALTCFPRMDLEAALCL